ncbi:uncharacterized protein B0H64DRAFT_114544 [Chaetomium fimeti]|uniref:Uncharacterized protein n=1 Tax=Chaetomium fimeti TaxID=1854472 RepID=A0AAE0LT98_9PEZI|nr:hypothetical protein B0H64DRAFT_114544 [Chaetomium fimeti]
MRNFFFSPCALPSRCSEAEEMDTEALAMTAETWALVVHLCPHSGFSVSQGVGTHNHGTFHFPQSPKKHRHSQGIKRVGFPAQLRSRCAKTSMVQQSPARDPAESNSHGLHTETCSIHDWARKPLNCSEKHFFCAITTRLSSGEAATVGELSDVGQCPRCSVDLCGILTLPAHMASFHHPTRRRPSHLAAMRACGLDSRWRGRWRGPGRPGGRSPTRSVGDQDDDTSLKLTIPLYQGRKRIQGLRRPNSEARWVC